MYIVNEGHIHLCHISYSLYGVYFICLLKTADDPIFPSIIP